MALPFRRILSPVEFDDNSLAALDVAANLARQTAATVFVLHVVPLVVLPGEVPAEIELYRSQEDEAKEKLQEIAGTRLKGVAHQILTRVGDPSRVIVQAAEGLGADVIVMATHGRRGLSRVLLGSVAERVVRDSPCPVLTVRRPEGKRGLVGERMVLSPVAASPGETLAEVQAKMHEGRFRSMPVVEAGKLVGIVTDRDIREHAGHLEHTTVATAMTKDVLTVKPDTSIWDAARLLLDHKIGGLPVIEEGKVVGMVTSSDLLRAFVDLAH